MFGICREHRRSRLEAVPGPGPCQRGRRAIDATDLVGRGTETAADQAAVDAMRTELNRLDIRGRVVIGEGESDRAPMLYIGEIVGTGEGGEVDIALDPLEGTTLCVKAMPNALSVISQWGRADHPCTLPTGAPILVSAVKGFVDCERIAVWWTMMSIVGGVPIVLEKKGPPA